MIHIMKPEWDADAVPPLTDSGLPACAADVGVTLGSPNSASSRSSGSGTAAAWTEWPCSLLDSGSRADSADSSVSGAPLSISESSSPLSSLAMLLTPTRSSGTTFAGAVALPAFAVSAAAGGFARSAAALLGELDDLVIVSGCRGGSVPRSGMPDALGGRSQLTEVAERA